MHGKQSKNFSIFIPAIAGIVAAFMVILVSVKYGLAMSPDSACYLSIAENILKGNGFTIYDYMPAVHWPPLYPLALALGGLFNFEISAWARVLNALLFGLTVYFSSRWIFSKIENKILGIVGVLGLLFSLPLFYVAKSVWSETLFIFLIALFLIRLEKSILNHTVKDVLILGVLAAMACLTKYLGVALVFSYLIGLFFLKADLRQKLINAVIFSAVSLTPLLFWMWRNYLVSGTLAGRRTGSAASLLKNFLLSIDSISIWFMTLRISPSIRVPVVGTIILLIVIWYFRKNWGKLKGENIPSILWVNGVFIAVYMAYLLAVSSIVAFDKIDQRFTVHIYIPLLVSLVFVLDRILQNTVITSKTTTRVGLFLVTFWILYLGQYTISDIKHCLRDGAGGYSHIFWRNSKFTAYLEQNLISGKIYSNFPDGVYILTGQSAFMSPRKHFHLDPSELTDDVKVLESELEQVDAVYLAWFARQGRSFLFTPEELMLFFDLKETKVLHEGVLYKLSNLDSTDTP